MEAEVTLGIVRKSLKYEESDIVLLGLKFIQSKVESYLTTFSR